MGYGFGIWLVPEGGFLKHFTISCFMEKGDAEDLFKKIIEKYLFLDVKLLGKHKIYDPDYYPDDDNGLYSWGYNGFCEEWSGLKILCDPFKCCFSNTPHMSMQYSENVDELNVFDKDDVVYNCKVCLVDIRSDDCNKWKILN